MGILDSFPHRCTISRRIRTKRTLGGSKDSSVDEQTNVLCWEQNANHVEITDYEKMGMAVNRKIYFLTDPGVTVRHQISITSRNGVAIASPIELEVRTEALPDASAGMGVVYKVMAEQITSRSN